MIALMGPIPFSVLLAIVCVAAFVLIVWAENQ